MREIHGKQVCETIEEVLDPSGCAVVVIDLQNDFIRPDGSVAGAGADMRGMDGILDRCASFIAGARAVGVPIVHIQTITLRDGRSDSPSWLRAKGGIVGADFTLEGTDGAEICAEVAPLPGETVVVKHRSSAFRQTDLDLVLRAAGVRTVVVIGVQTPGCVEATYRDAAYHDYYNVLIEDCVAAYDQAQHEASLLVQRGRHDVCTAGAALSIWRQAAGRAAGPPGVTAPAAV
ncbi:MAG: biuret amidohydrolase [Solirubrobacteraceae bacterium]|nr:biuret amidohydrolase [Solirubrobacteraceae bacterium]